MIPIAQELLYSRNSDRIKRKAEIKGERYRKCNTAAVVAELIGAVRVILGRAG